VQGQAECASHTDCALRGIEVHIFERDRVPEDRLFGMIERGGER
jgi:hypothetical protein